MSIWPRSCAASTRRIAPTRVTLPITAFRLEEIVPSMRCGLMRPHLKRWRRSRTTSPSTRTGWTGSANRRLRQRLSLGNAPIAELGLGLMAQALFRSYLLSGSRRIGPEVNDQPTDADAESGQWIFQRN